MPQGGGGQQSDRQFQLCRGRDLHLVQQPTAVAQRRSVVEQPRHMLAASIEDRPSIRCECIVHLGKQAGDPSDSS